MVQLQLARVGSCRQREWFATRGSLWQEITFPAMIAVIRHPRLGVILFDTGYGEALRRAASAALYRRILPFDLPDEERLGARLRQLDAERVDLVFVSHFHPDHVGGLREVPGAPPIVASREGFERKGTAYFPELLPDDFAERFQAVEDLGPEYDLAGDGSLIAVPLPGHAPGQYGLMCRTAPDERVLLCADAAWVVENVTRPVEPAWPVMRFLVDDAEAFRESLRELHRIAREEPDVVIIPSHCERSITAYQNKNLPVETAAEYEREFPRRNVLGLTIERARSYALDEVAGRATPYPGFSFGLSTGSTGVPGVFLTTAAERQQWTRAMVAKFLPLSMLLMRPRIALILKHNNQLYGVPRLAYFDAADPVEHWAARLCEFRPEVIVGPASVLEALAATREFEQKPIKPRLLLAGAEPLFPQDAALLEAAYETAPRVIYQAKEGFLAFGCERGSIHLNEDLIHFEAIDVGQGRVIPVITDLRRTSQTYRRYRLDDVLQLAQDACPCGRNLARIAAVEGRAADVLLLADGRRVFPLEVNKTVLPFLLPTEDYRLTQTEARRFTLEGGGEAAWALSKLLGEQVEVLPFRPENPGVKRRRVRRMFDLENRWIEGVQSSVRPLREIALRAGRHEPPLEIG
jgi:putative adenylate-forming enzyme